MQIAEIVNFWRGQQEVDQRGRWTHRRDRDALDAKDHSFNLDHPVGPYIGDVLTAPVIILGSNAGYNRNETPDEFRSADSIDSYIARVDEPDKADWSIIPPYYNRTNYGHLIGPRKVAIVNACAYRSPLLSAEDDNRAKMKLLESVIFTRKWLLEALLPIAKKGERLIVIKRGRAWDLPATATPERNVAEDRWPRFPNITGNTLAAMTAFLDCKPEAE